MKTKPTPEKPKPDRGSDFQAEMHEAFAAGWNAFLATHSGLLIAHGIKDFRIGFEQRGKNIARVGNNEEPVSANVGTTYNLPKNYIYQHVSAVALASQERHRF